MAKNVFERAIDVIRHRGWHQGYFTGADGSVCILKALGEATRVRGTLEDWFALTGRVMAAAGTNNLALWNDDPSTTEEDVILALKHAAATWEGD